MNDEIKMLWTEENTNCKQGKIARNGSVEGKFNYTSRKFEKNDFAEIL